jgi:transposase
VVVTWGEDLRPRRPRRPVERWDSPTTLIAAVIWLVVLLWLGPRALDLEHQNEQARTAAHVAAMGAK